MSAYELRRDELAGIGCQDSARAKERVPVALNSQSPSSVTILSIKVGRRVEEENSMRVWIT